MRKTLLLFLAGFLAFNFQMTAQVTVSLGTLTGASSTNALLSTSTTINRYSRTMSLYTAQEINTAGGMAGFISSLAWGKSGTGEYTSNDAYIKVLLKHTTNNVWSTSPVPDWNTEIMGATQVFTSSAYSIPTGTGWKQVPFTTPFLWDGTSNIVIFVEWSRPSTPTADISWERSTDANTNATRVGSTSLDALVMLINANRPLVQLNITALNINEFENSPFKLYPNPTKDILFLTSEKSITKYVIYNAIGEIIKDNYQITSEEINVTDLSSGVYYIKVFSEEKTEVLKWIKI
ncbi:MAG: T9SS type A sorting domain-containing protein [Flavobacterium sp.]|uniref:T9SS type A sorting domain-containing protein n=1 Tax=Flavobacterium sp. TaxID=239 RepID=UPI003267E97D